MFPVPVSLELSQNFDFLLIRYVKWSLSNIFIILLWLRSNNFSYVWFISISISVKCLIISLAIFLKKLTFWPFSLVLAGALYIGRLALCDMCSKYFPFLSFSLFSPQLYGQLILHVKCSALHCFPPSLSHPNILRASHMPGARPLTFLFPLPFYF